MFDEASSWWSSETTLVHFSKEFENKMQDMMGEPSELTIIEHVSTGEKELLTSPSKEKTSNPLKIGLHKDHTQRKLEDEKVQLRRSFRPPKPKSRYESVALLEESIF